MIPDRLENVAFAYFADMEFPQGNLPIWHKFAIVALNQALFNLNERSSSHLPFSSKRHSPG
jgi:hypothetical protein